MRLTLDELARDLPSGLHDARLEGLSIDWLAGVLTFDVVLMMSEHQDLDQRARITVTGLAWCCVDGPARVSDWVPTEPMPYLRIDAGPGPANDEAAGLLPPTPAGTFVHWLYVNPWNSFIQICGREASIVWLEAAPVAGRAESPALFPGDSIPDPQ